ncbi:hypothetical protein EYZ11_005021 [Aspergillus tanneri]|uniref:Uncharacterized protein n=1 Tax=Aspergillus tanneri TaxID=1220188 RepID=A0A4S3JJ16_9EURO|nr:uncharacterized protein ATNIH1004_002684 [Aspergillus tanneri]KAA8650004.1 hypothetical protein ATNIH1004_002684 [Aspergillus tanneri]THC95506.1 hypothetical protein EYZ11_005021 [Aspergillus tanneri]
MAEPEDVEEDLFADLYDADDAGNQTTSAVETSQVPHAIPSDTSAQYSSTPHAQSFEQVQEQTGDSRDIYQNPQSQGGFQGSGGDLDPVFGHNVTITPAESEPQGTGIKEDG